MPNPFILPNIEIKGNVTKPPSSNLVDVPMSATLPNILSSDMGGFATDTQHEIMARESNISHYYNRSSLIPKLNSSIKKLKGRDLALQDNLAQGMII